MSSQTSTPVRRFRARAPLTQPVRRAVTLVGSLVPGWPVESQQRARRNAMLACTALARSRAEREEVDAFLAARTGGSTGGSTLEVPVRLAR